jgi:hypothetical protein
VEIAHLSYFFELVHTLDELLCALRTEKNSKEIHAGVRESAPKYRIFS